MHPTDTIHRALRLSALVCALVGLAVCARPAAALDAAQIFDQVRHAIYLVVVTSDDSSVVEIVATGSAVLIAPGRLVTNCHVVEAGPNAFVARRDDKISERVRVVHSDKAVDLCELDLVESRPGFDKPVQIAPRDGLKVGEPVYAIGAPRGMELTISNGIVSAIREVGKDSQLIQTNTPISAGSSGGGLFDSEARLVGITTMGIRDAQNLNFAISARHIRSAGISAADLQNERTRTHALPAGESAFERKERLRRQEENTIAVRKKQLEAEIAAAAPAQAAAPRTTTAAAAVPPPRPVTTRRTAAEMAALLVPYQGSGDKRPQRVYEKLDKAGGLAGLDDSEVVRKVYSTLIAEQVAQQFAWREGGSLAAEFEVQLRRNGEIMYILPARSSGQDRFDREAQGAIGSASPFPVPQDNAAFEIIRNLRLVVTAPAPAPAQAPQPAAKPPKKK